MASRELRAGRADRDRPTGGVGGRFGLLLLVLVATYLLSAFSNGKVTTGVQIALISGVLGLALRSSPIPGRWVAVIAAVTLAGSAAAIGVLLTGTSAGHGAADVWTALILLLAVVLIVRRVLARPSVTIQSIYGALSAYLVTGLMFAACYSAMEHLGPAPFFAGGQPESTQTFQYFSFTTLTTLGYGDFTAAGSGGRAVAVLEAVAGQVYLATLVARLVSAYRSSAQPDDQVPGRAGARRRRAARAAAFSRSRPGSPPRR
ncbi:MAG TPA: potassium channel family protein [Trebonia sp.]|nr:potassium channel family protein [Trebonia sp.]